MTSKLNIYSNNFDVNIANIFLHKISNIPEYKFYTYKNHVVHTVKTNLPNKKCLTERYMYNINDKDKIIVSCLIYNKKLYILQNGKSILFNNNFF